MRNRQMLTDTDYYNAEWSQSDREYITYTFSAGEICKRVNYNTKEKYGTHFKQKMNNTMAIYV